MFILFRTILVHTLIHTYNSYVLYLYIIFPSSPKLFRDQRRKSRHRHFKTRWWPLGAIYFFLFDASIANAVVLFKDSNHPDFTNAAAKPTLIDEMLRLFPALEAQRSISLDDVKADEDAYFNVQLPPIPVIGGPLLGSQAEQLQSCLAPFIKWTYEEALTLRLDASLRHAPHFIKFRGRCPLHSCNKYSYYWCKVCGIPLHFGRCFEVFHGIENLDSLDL